MNTTTTPDTAARWGPVSGSMARRSAPRWVRWVGWLLHNPVPVLTLAAVVGLVVAVGPVAAVAVVVMSAVGCVVWARWHRPSWDATGGRVLLGAWRTGWTYGVRWRASMIFVGLAGSLDGHEWVGEFQRSVHGPGHDDRCCDPHRPLESPGCQARRCRCPNARRSLAR